MLKKLVNGEANITTQLQNLQSFWDVLLGTLVTANGNPGNLHF